MPKQIHNLFEKYSDKLSKVVGSPTWFFFSVFIIILWLPTGFFIGFNEIWHLLINTFTTIFTFLMMSLLHASQNKWEKKIEILEKKQERTLKLLEKNTKEIKSNLESAAITTENPEEQSEPKSKSNFISSLL